jgi:hypothetical protein
MITIIDDEILAMARSCCDVPSVSALPLKAAITAYF